MRGYFFAAVVALVVIVGMVLLAGVRGKIGVLHFPLWFG